MATAGTKIDVKKGLLTMTVFNETISFKIFDAMKSPFQLEDCFVIDVVDDLVKDTFIESISKDPLETSIAYSGMDFHDEGIKAAGDSLEKTPIVPLPFRIKPPSILESAWQKLKEL